jgi:hypothetical protein
VYKVIRLFIDDSKGIVETASMMMAKRDAFMGEMRVSGDMRRTTESKIQSGYVVKLEDYENRIKATCQEYDDILVISDTEDDCMTQIISEIEKKLNSSTSITRTSER